MRFEVAAPGGAVPRGTGCEERDMARLRGSWPEAEASPGPETFHVEHGRVRKVPIPRLLRPAWEGGTFHVEQDAGRDGASSGARAEGGGGREVPGGARRGGIPYRSPDASPYSKVLRGTGKCCPGSFDPLHAGEPPEGRSTWNKQRSPLSYWRVTQPPSRQPPRRQLAGTLHVERGGPLWLPHFRASGGSPPPLPCSTWNQRTPCPVRGITAKEGGLAAQRTVPRGTGS